MEKRKIKVQALRGFALVLCAAASMALWNCNSPKPRGNFQKEYNELFTKDFHSLEEAKTVTSTFISKYGNSKKYKEYCDTVRQIEDAFASMDTLFTEVNRCDPKQRYNEFLTMVKLNEPQFSGSCFAIVRNTWNYLLRENDAVYMEECYGFCQKEYDQLSIKEFHSLEEAKAAIDTFMVKYGEIEKCSDYCAKMKDISEEFEVMERLFYEVEESDPEYRYCDFVEIVNSIDGPFSKSSFETVRKTWAYLESEKKNAYLMEMLDTIDEDSFKSMLIGFAESEVMKRYQHKDFSLDYSNITNNTLDDFSVVKRKGALVKKGSCKVSVHIKGNKLKDGSIWEGLRRHGVVDVSVEGFVSIQESSCEPITKVSASIIHEDVDKSFF